MGNRLACGCSAGGNGQSSYGDSPYSKQMSKNMFRFWAEVFLLAEESASSSTGTNGGAGANRRKTTTKWQLVTAKLVPVNLARVQATPTVVSHVTAYDTKTEKILDVLVYYPGIDLYRGSECFVYWTDPQRGLTWGLNFIRSEDADYFTDLVQRSKVPSQPPTPEVRGASASGTFKASVKFSDQVHALSHPSTPTATNNSSPPNPTQLFVTGHRLSHWGTMLPRQFDAASNQSASTTQEDDDETDTEAVQRRLSSENYTTASCGGADDGSSASLKSEQYDNVVTTGGCQRHANSANVTPTLLSVRSLAKQQQAMAAHGQQTTTVTTIEEEEVSPYRLQEPLPANAIEEDDLTTTTVVLDSSFTQTPAAADYEKTVRPRHVNFPNETLTSSSSTLAQFTAEQRPRLLLPSSTSVSHQMNVSANGESSVSSSMSFDDAALLRRQSSPPPPPSSVPADGSWDLGRILPYRPKKGGFLLVKRWLTHHDQESGTATGGKQTGRGRLVVVEQEHWRQFWVRLKGFQLNLYKVANNNANHEEPSCSSTNDQSSTPERLNSRDTLPLSLCLSNCLVQPLPEHPRRENVFCFSTNTGDAYLLQASSDAEVESWISSIHTVAAMELSRSTSIEVTMNHTKRQLEKLDKQIEATAKSLGACKSQMSRSMTSSVSLPNDQEMELERLHVEYFVNRCYMAALSASESPSCKKALAAASPSTKQYLSQMGVFTMVALHVYVCGRRSTPSPLQNHTAASASHPNASPSTSHHVRRSQSQTCGGDNHVEVLLPTGQKTVVSVSKEDCVSRLLTKTCERFGLSQSRHVILLRNVLNARDFFAAQDDYPILQLTDRYTVELGEHLAYHVHLSKRGRDGRRHPLGLTVRAISVDQRVKAWVTAVEFGSSAQQQGIGDGDELLAINCHAIRAQTYPPIVENLLQNETDLCLTLRTKRLQLPGGGRLRRIDANSIDNLNECPERTNAAHALGAVRSTTTSTQASAAADSSPSSSWHVRRRQLPPPVPSRTTTTNQLPLTGGGDQSSMTNQLPLSSTTNQQPSMDQSTTSATPNHHLLPPPAPPQVNLRKTGSPLLTTNHSNGAVTPTSALRSCWPKMTLTTPIANRYHQSQQNNHRFSLPVAPSVATIASSYLYASPVFNREVASSSVQSSPFHQHKARCDQVTEKGSVGGPGRKRTSTSEPSGDIGWLSSGNGGTPRSTFVGGKIDNAHKLERLIFEMIETERAYIQHLNRLVEQYLEPLAAEWAGGGRRLRPVSVSSSTEEDCRLLLSTTHAVCRFQSTLLDELHEAAANDSVSTYPTDSQLRHALLRIGGVFLNRSHKFKVYSAYCVMHSKILKQLHQEESKNDPLRRFLESRNAEAQHSTTFESYLIKPVQRLLRYPLFLHQMKLLTADNTPEHMQISQALVKMEKMAAYINEMQKVHEEYGHIFANVHSNNSALFEKKRLNVKPSELLMMGTIDWLNSDPKSGAMPLASAKKKAAGNDAVASLECYCFVFKTLILLRYSDRSPDKLPKSAKKKAKESATTPGGGSSSTKTFDANKKHLVIPIQEVELNVSDAGSTDDRFIWILIHMQQDTAVETVYHFANRQREDKHEFVRAIRKAAGAFAVSSSSSASCCSSVATVAAASLGPASSSTPTADKRHHYNHHQKQQQPTQEQSATAGVAASNSGGGNSQRHSISSPDSGYPFVTKAVDNEDEKDDRGAEDEAPIDTVKEGDQGEAAYMTMISSMTLIQEDDSTTRTTATLVDNQRNSQTSSQSDCGYASNSEKQTPIASEIAAKGASG